MSRLWTLSVLLAAGCAGYTSAPIDPLRMLEDRAFGPEEIRIALDRLEKTRLFPGRDVHVNLEDGLTFEEAFVAALVLSPRLESLRESIKGREHLVQAVSGIQSVSFDVKDDGPPGGRRGKVGLMFDLLSQLGLGDKPARIGKANAEVARAVCRLHDAEWGIFSALRVGILRLRLKRDKLDAYRKLKTAFEKHVASAAVPLQRLGRISLSELNRVQNLRDRLTVILEGLRAEEEVALNRLKEVVGFLPESPVTFHADETAPTRKPDWRIAFQRRWDLQTLLAEYQVAEQDLRLEVLSQYPDIRIGPAFRFGEGGDIFGGAVSLQIPDPWTVSARIESATRRRAAVRHRIEQRLLTIRHELDNQWETLQSASLSAETWASKSLPRFQAETDRAVARLRLNPGALREAVRQFGEQLTAVERYWNLEEDRITAVTALERAAGYPLK